jgi:hypothetical protein
VVVAALVQVLGRRLQEAMVAQVVVELIIQAQGQLHLDKVLLAVLEAVAVTVRVVVEGVLVLLV